SGFPTKGNVYGVFDVDSQYTISIDDVGRVECTLVTGATAYTTNVNVMTGDGEWGVVACSYDGAELCAMSLRPNGMRTHLCAARSGAVNPAPTSGAGIGAWIDSLGTLTQHFVGALDSIRLYDRGMTLAEVCAAAGLSGC